MLNGILQAALTRAQRACGLRLVEPDDHTVELQLDGETIARFTIYVTSEEIRQVAEKTRLNKLHNN